MVTRWNTWFTACCYLNEDNIVDYLHEFIGVKITEQDETGQLLKLKSTLDISKDEIKKQLNLLQM